MKDFQKLSTEEIKQTLDFLNHVGINIDPFSPMLDQDMKDRFHQLGINFEKEDPFNLTNKLLVMIEKYDSELKKRRLLQ